MYLLFIGIHRDAARMGRLLKGEKQAAAVIQDIKLYLVGRILLDQAVKQGLQEGTFSGGHHAADSQMAALGKGYRKWPLGLVGRIVAESHGCLQQPLSGRLSRLRKTVQI